MLQIHPLQLQAIAAHAERTYPEECCGLLIGQIERDNRGQDDRAQEDRKTVVEVRPVPNAWSPEAAAALLELQPERAAHQEILTRQQHYWIDPSDMLEAQRYARAQRNSSKYTGLDIIGIYHSHPDHPAIPSECDRVCAWPQYAYVIVSVQQGTAQDTRCWRLDEQHQFQAEDIICLNEAPFDRSTSVF